MAFDTGGKWRSVTLEYQINVQQILFNFWVLAHLHAYFVLHISTEKNVVENLFFTTYFYLHAYLVYTFIRYLRVFIKWQKAEWILVVVAKG